MEPIKPKTVRFPKLIHTNVYEIKIQRGQIAETKKACRFRLIKQEIEGVTIPNGFEVWIPGLSASGVKNSFSLTPSVLIGGWQLEPILKMLVMEGLRNQK